MHVLSVLVLATALISVPAWAKSTFLFTVQCGAEKAGVRWQKDGSYTVDILLSDAAQDRAVRSATILPTGKIMIDGADAQVPLPAGFLAALKAAGAALDKLIEALAKAKRLSL